MAGGEVVEHGTVLDTFVRPRADATRDFVDTIVPRGLPRRVVDQLGGDGLWRMLLLDAEVEQPLITGLIRDVGVDVNMLHADMTQIQDHTVGQLIIKVTGTPEKMREAHRYLSERVVELEEVVA
jgi:D-methionine transport system ATP-binding protein